MKLSEVQAAAQPDAPKKLSQIQGAAAQQAAEDTPDQSVALPDEPGKVYGNILPFSQDTKTGETKLAFPRAIRDPVHIASRSTQEMSGQRPIDRQTLAQGAMLGVGGAAGGELAAQIARDPAVWDAATDLAQTTRQAAMEGVQAVRDLPETLIRAPTSDVALRANMVGYKFPPKMVAEDKPAPLTRGLEAWSGKIKTEQAASARNQAVTNALAARDLGLPAEAQLTPKVLADVRAHASDAYDAVRRAVPVIRADREYLQEIGQLGGQNSQAAKYFPKIMEKREIKDLIDELKSRHVAPTGAVMQIVKTLRVEGNADLKTAGDSTKHALGLSKRAAANAIEDLIARNIEHSEQYFGEQFAHATRAERLAQQNVSNAQRDLTVTQSKVQTSSNVYVQNRVLREEREATEALRKAQQDLDQVQRAKAHATTLLRNAQADKDKGALVDRYKAARTRIAKSYDIEGAMNPATGDVNAIGIGKLGRKGKPLTDGLQIIADTANAFPRALRDPTKAGGVEDLSVIDFFTGGAALAAGRPEVAGAVLGRPAARSLMLSGPFQKRMMGPPTRPQAAPLDTTAQQVLSELGLDQ